MTASSLTRQTRVLMQSRRFVVLDTETTGLAWNARVLSLGVVELWPDLLGRSQTWYCNPGPVNIEPQAAAKNRITREHLRGQPSFIEVRPQLDGWLRTDEPTVLVGHNIDFDWRRLLHEYGLAGAPPPKLLLLDTGHLARETGLVCGPALDDVLRALGLSNPAKHVASGDALATAQAAQQLLRTLAQRTAAEDLPERLTPLLQAAPGRVDRRVDDAPMTPEHDEAHQADLRRKAAREAALDICLREKCPELAHRMEDGITTGASARSVAEWALAHLEGSRLSRRLRGRLLGGLGRALRRHGDPVYAEHVLLERLTPLLTEWGPCSRSSRCGRCLHEAGTCRFTDIGRQAVRAAVAAPKDQYGAVGKRGADLFMPGFDPSRAAPPGRPPEGLYQRLRRAGHLDAAGYGAALVGEYRRRTGSRDWAYAVLRKAWNDGCRTPHLTEHLVSMIVADGIGPTGRVASDGSHIALALDLLDEGLNAHRSGRGEKLNRLRQRRGQLAQMTGPRPVRASARPRNQRTPAAHSLGRPPAGASTA